MIPWESQHFAPLSLEVNKVKEIKCSLLLAQLADFAKG